MGFWHISSIHAQNRAFDHFCRQQQQLADVCEKKQLILRKKLETD